MKTKRRLPHLIIITLVCFGLLIGCNKKVDQLDVIDNVTFELISKDVNLDTTVEYVIKMTNNSEYKIVQNNVLFSFINEPSDSGETTNPFSVIATDNQLNIESGESINLTVRFSPVFYEKFTKSEVEKANLYFTGYFGELEEANHFDFTESIKLK